MFLPELLTKRAPQVEQRRCFRLFFRWSRVTIGLQPFPRGSSSLLSHLLSCFFSAVSFSIPFSCLGFFSFFGFVLFRRRLLVSPCPCAQIPVLCAIRRGLSKRNSVQAKT